MHLIACVDADGGTLFGRRRQSQDRVLRAWLLGYAAAQGSRIVASPYTAGQFAPADDIAVSDQPFDDADPTDFVFAEDRDPAPFADLLSSVLLVRWNRRYPHDHCFPEALLAGRSRRLVAEFEGSSHPRITVESWI